MAQLEHCSAVNISCGSEHSLFPLTSLQVQLCKQYPDLVSLMMTDVVRIFQQHCQSQFRHERWDCKNITPPVFGTTQPFSTLRECYSNVSVLLSTIQYNLITAHINIMVTMRRQSIVHMCWCLMPDNICIWHCDAAINDSLVVLIFNFLLTC